MCVSRYNAGHSEALQTEDVVWSLSSHSLFFDLLWLLSLMFCFVFLGCFFLLEVSG